MPISGFHMPTTGVGGCIGAVPTLVGTGAGRGGSSKVPLLSLVLRRGSSCFCCCRVILPIGGRFKSLVMLVSVFEVIAGPGRLTTLVEQPRNADYS